MIKRSDTAQLTSSGSFLVGLRAVVWSRLFPARLHSRVSDGALVKPAKVGDALGRFWAGSPFFLGFPLLSVSRAQTELESTGVVGAGWCLAAGLAATLDAQKDKLEVVPELLFFPKNFGWGCVCSSCSCVPGFFPDSSSGKFDGKTVKRIFEFTGFLACDPHVMIPGS